jgi:hypothetical protein
MTTVRQHERKAPSKPPEYINTHLALFDRRADKIAFCRRHGVELVEHGDARLSVPIPSPSPGPGRRPLAEIATQIAAIAKSLGRIA